MWMENLWKLMILLWKTIEFTCQKICFRLLMKLLSGIFPLEIPLLSANHQWISFTNAYDKNGNGLHHFVDPEDHQEYLYSNF